MYVDTRYDAEVLLTKHTVSKSSNLRQEILGTLLSLTSVTLRNKDPTTEGSRVKQKTLWAALNAGTFT